MGGSSRNPVRQKREYWAPADGGGANPAQAGDAKLPDPKGVAELPNEPRDRQFGYVVLQRAAHMNSDIRHARGGQVTLEYFILFAIVGLLTLAGLTTVDDQVRTRLEGFFRAAANDIAH